MSYQSSDELARDPVFRGRLQAALYTESRVLPDDELAVGVMQVGGLNWFVPYVSTAPGFPEKFAQGGSAAITDADLLSAVQANWDAVAGTASLPNPPA